MGADKRPEELINYYAQARVSVRKIANAVGFFALLWSTVVLLGGFVSVLTIKDFWSLSVLSLLMASKMLEIWDTNIGGIYMPERHILRLAKGQDQLVEDGRLYHRTNIFIVFIAASVKIVLVFCTFVIVSASPYVALLLSVVRLIQRDYGEAGGDATNKAKLNAALIIFYVLVIFQSLSFSYYAFLTVHTPWMFISKQIRFGIWGPKIVRKYKFATRGKCVKDGVLPNNWNLITFSVGLLESASPEDRLWGARVLDTFIGQGIPIRQELLSSSQAIQNLINMIGLTRTDNPEIRERAARIVGDLAGELRITQFQDLLRCICCLLESCVQYSDAVFAPQSEKSEQTPDKNSHEMSAETFEHSHHQENAHLSLAITEQTDHKQIIDLAADKVPKRRSWTQTMQCIVMTRTAKERRDWDRYFGDKYHYSYASKGSKELISQGLAILEKLTQDEDNCIEIIRHQRLLSKITLSLSSLPWVEILTVVSRLISAGHRDDTTRLCHDISHNPAAIHTLMNILEVDSEGDREVQEQAIEIIMELAFDDYFRKLALTERLAKMLVRIFLENGDGIGNAIVEKEDKEKDKRVRRKAGEALARLLRIPSAGDNTEALTSATNAYVVDLLPKQEMINLLTKVVNQILSSKGEKAEDVVTLARSSNGFHVEMVVQSQTPKGSESNTSQSSTQETKEQSEDSKMLAAMLSLTVAICNQNVICADDFIRAIPDDATLVQKLKEIVELEKDATADGWRILKLVCQVVIAVIQLKPSCIREFNEHNFKEALSKGLETMKDVDNCMLFAGDEREVPARSLTSLVKEALELLAQQQGDISV